MRSMLQCRTGGWRAELQEQPGTHEKALPAGGGWQSPPLPENRKKKSPGGDSTGADWFPGRAFHLESFF